VVSAIVVLDLSYYMNLKWLKLVVPNVLFLYEYYFVTIFAYKFSLLFWEKVYFSSPGIEIVWHSFIMFHLVQINPLIN
jgi:hypothetical protein